MSRQISRFEHWKVREEDIRLGDYKFWHGGDVDAIVVQTAIKLLLIINKEGLFYDDSTERLLFFIIIYFILYRRGEGMDCQKVGDLIYRLRKEKQLTQKSWLIRLELVIKLYLSGKED